MTTFLKDDKNVDLQRIHRYAHMYTNIFHAEKTYLNLHLSVETCHYSALPATKIFLQQ